MNLLKLKATDNDEDRILFKFVIKSLNNIPVSRVEKLFRNKDIKVNGKRTNDKKYKVKKNDEIMIYGLADTTKDIVRKKIDIKFRVIFEDENILIVDKKPGYSIHGDHNSLDNQVLLYLKFVKVDSFTPSHISRIDKGSSGIVVYAKTYQALVTLTKHINAFEKIYQFRSELDRDTETRFRISHDEERMREVCGNFGRPTHTKFWREDGKQFAQLFTGRKHQIRASLSKMGVPIQGDMKYGGKRDKRMFLHSYSLTFRNLEDRFAYLNERTFTSNPIW